MKKEILSQILAELRTFETTRFSGDPDAIEALTEMTYTALVALLIELVKISDERDW